MEDEKKALLLPPKFALMEDMNINKFKLDLAITKTKIRYELKGFNPT